MTHASWPRTTLALVVALLAGCMDGPFPRVNPNDEAAEFTMRIVSNTDTLGPGRLRAVLQVVTEPTMNGYPPAWSVPPGRLAYHAGNGVIALADSPAAPTTITVTASYKFKSATKVLVILPVP